MYDIKRGIMARKTIGFQLNVLDSGYKTDILKAVENESERHNTNLILLRESIEGRKNPKNSPAQILDAIVSPAIDGYLLIDDSFEKFIDMQPKELLPEDDDSEETKEKPCISICESDFTKPSVVLDYKEKYCKLIEHMVAMHNCKTFNIVAGPEGVVEVERILETCISALEKHNIHIQEERIFYGNLDEESGYGAMVYFYQNQLLPADCIICVTDDMAQGVYSYAKKHNLEIPKDFALVAFGGTTRSMFNKVSFTTIYKNCNLIGKTSVDYLCKMMNGESVPQTIPIPCEIRYRKSCGCVHYSDNTTDYIDENGKTVNYEQNVLVENGENYFSLEHEVYSFRRFLNNINANHSLKEALSSIKPALKSMLIRSCAVVLFERRIDVAEESKVIVPSRAELILKYDENTIKPYSVKEEDTSSNFVMFNPKNGLLPEGTFSDRRRTLIVRSLFYDGNLFGYIVYEPGDLHISLYDAAFTMIVNSIITSILFTEKTATTRHQHNLLKKLEESNSRLNNMSLTDELTGLYNRRGFINFARQTIDLAVEMEQKGLVFYADMDGLKGINDTYGHEAGDVAIKTMSEILRKTFRNNDVVGRMGGDEFAIVAVGIGLDFIPKIRERIAAAEEKWYSEEQPPFRLGISFGAVEFGGDCSPSALTEESMEALLSEADKLLYKEKVKKHSRSSIKEKPMEQRQIDELVDKAGLSVPKSAFKDTV